MKIPVSWLGDFISLQDLPVEEIAHRLTLAGLEVDEIRYVGGPGREASASRQHEFKTTGLSWDSEKLVVAEIREVLPHPNADRLTLLDLYDGRQTHTVLTGAPNIFHLKGKGRLAAPIRVAYAKEGALLYDGHAEGSVPMTLKRTKIRGVDSYSMVCSEKELGISDEHEGIIVLDADAPLGMPLADYMGDAVLDISILPNMARCASVLGIARELSALTGRKLVQPQIKYKTGGAPVKDSVSIEIADPKLNPRFVLGLIRNVELKPSPYAVQRRLKLAGMRPINCIVDATNYSMLELGEPLHAFDYDVLLERAGKRHVKIITRAAGAGEKLTTLDDIERTLTPLNVLVCDQAGPLSIAGVMGGAESEVTQATRAVLLEGAAWNFINIRRTARQLSLPSEASFRFSRGVHPAMAEPGVKRGLQYMAAWSGGVIAPGLVDAYPLKPRVPRISFTPADVRRLLGIELSAKEIVRLLERLEFTCKVAAPQRGARKSVKARGDRSQIVDSNARITVSVPAHRLDIGEGATGLADVLEEIARLYGYDRIPSTNMADALPPQIGNPAYEWEEGLRDHLTALGFDEVVSYRLTSPEREARLGLTGPHTRIANPIAPERSVLRRSLLASVLDNLERNIRWSDSLAFFEVGPVFEPRANDVPNEPRRLALAMSGFREPVSWDAQDRASFDFYDLKGRIELLLSALHLSPVEYAPTTSVTYLHPGKAAEIRLGGKIAGVMGELHPTVSEEYELGQAPVLVAEFSLEALRSAHSANILPVPEFPPVIEDIALIMDESVPAARIEDLIRQTGGEPLADVRLFDIYRGEQIGAGKKSLAYRLTYQAPDRTMNDAEAAALRNKIVHRLEHEFGAMLRS